MLISARSAAQRFAESMVTIELLLDLIFIFIFIIMFVLGELSSVYYRPPMKVLARKHP